MADFTSGTPNAGAQVTATHKEADGYCNGVLYTGISVTASFTTNGTTWYALDATNAGTYSFGATYPGHAYDLSAQMEPVSVTCATLYVPSLHECHVDRVQDNLFVISVSNPTKIPRDG